MDTKKQDKKPESEWWNETPVNVKPTGKMKAKKALKIVLIVTVVLIFLSLIAAIVQFVFLGATMAQDPDIQLQLKILFFPIWALWEFLKFIVVFFFTEFIPALFS